MIRLILEFFGARLWAQIGVAVLAGWLALQGYGWAKFSEGEAAGRQEAVQQSVETARGKAGEIRDEISRSRPDGALERMRQSGACRDC